jgi:hypothetical protein
VNTLPAASAEVRTRLVEALKLDLVGPWAGHPLADERLPARERPSNWYLTGFLIPSGTPPDRRADLDEDDDMQAEVAEEGGLAEESNDEAKAARKAYFPSSMGLSFLVPAETQALTVTVRWGDYTRAEIEDDTGETTRVWQRHPREVTAELPLKDADGSHVHDLAGSGGLQLHVAQRTISAAGFDGLLPQGTRSVSVFLVNRRAPAEKDGDADVAYVFQPEVGVRAPQPFVPRPDPRGSLAAEWDERVSDLHYSDTPEYATGHGVSAEWQVANDECRVLRTAWIPSAEVEKTKTAAVDGVELSMDVLGAITDGNTLEAALQPLVVQYRTWIAEQRVRVGDLAGSRGDTARELLRLAGIAADRIERGIGVLAADTDALDAFRVANRAVAEALKRRLGNPKPRWRAFQLAFILLNLPGLADPHHHDREAVDLLFFPTGGGKTEAYLGLAAFTIVLRRLRHHADDGRAGAGVSVMMRYTLRLLTLDQLARAAGLICALELERERDPVRYGTWPFEIGLWVGKGGTPNLMGKKGDGRTDAARSKVIRFKNDSKSNPSPIPLENCPWCGTRFAPESFALLPNDDAPAELRIVCINIDCDFMGATGRSLPIVAVDEPLYRRLPAFLIATVDKFAALPWVGESGVLLGGADRYDDAGFYGAAEPGRGKRLGTPIAPPDLVIQDELHLIAGPLGTMAGLYETAIDALCTREIDNRAVRPKIVASTATVRRAQDQIQALFARPLTQVFPPPGPDHRDSFFARVVAASEVPARLYLGITSQGRSPKVMMRRVWLALMGAAERAYSDAGGKDKKNPADPYMTLLGYFNSLRELGGARRILEEEVQNTIKSYGARKRVGETRGLFRDRKTFSEVVELTSRVSTAKVAEARRRLEATVDEDNRVDSAIATNMISVGLDIPRLGLMVVLGQPKTHAEYIQATSRVGRDDERPGLVVTLLNFHKPRDRSHYERFRHYHETFYRAVEVSSVTPFSARALDRGLAGAVVALARHREALLTPPRGAEQIATVRGVLEPRVLAAFLDRVRDQPIAEEERDERLRSVQNRVVDLLDSWRKVFEDYHAVSVAMKYQRYESGPGRPLLHEILETDFESEHHRKFRVNRSLRDVEPEVNLFLRELTGAPVEDAK